MSYRNSWTTIDQVTGHGVSNTEMRRMKSSSYILFKYLFNTAGP